MGITLAVNLKHMTLIESIKEWETTPQQSHNFSFILRHDEIDVVVNDLKSIYEIEIEEFYPVWFDKMFRLTISHKRLFLAL